MNVQIDFVIESAQSLVVLYIEFQRFIYTKTAGIDCLDVEEPT